MKRSIKIFKLINITLSFIATIFSQNLFANLINENIYEDLFNAAQEGDLKTLTSLIDTNNIDINIELSSGLSLLHYACKSDNLDLINYLIDNGIELSKKSKICEEPIHIAALYGKLETVKLLIENYKINPNVQGADNAPVLSYAAISGNLELIKFLVTSGADPNGRNLYNEKPIHVAALSGHLNLVKYFIEDLKLYNPQHRSTYLFDSSVESLEIIEYLLKNNICRRPLRFANEGEDLIHVAINKNKLNIIKYLIDNRYASINHVLRNNRNLLHYACSLKNIDLKIIKYFLASGLRADSEDAFRNQPIFYALKNNAMHVADYLIEQYDIDPDLKDNHNMSVFQYSLDNEELTHKLIKRGTNLETLRDHICKQFELIECSKEIGGHLKLINNLEGFLKIYSYAIDYYGQRLIESIRKAKINDINIFLNKIVNLRAQDTFGFTPLHWAVFHNFIKLVKVLIQLNSPLNTKSKGNAITPLHLACHMGHTEIAKFLINSGANIFAEDAFGNLPYDYAKLNNNLEILDLLEEKLK